MAGFMVMSAATPTVFAQRPPPDLQAGRAAYEQSCARCHGLTAHGDGLDAKRFYPRPRDLSAGVYKFRTTASGTVPTDDDLFRTITNGLPGSNMPDWKHLSEPTRWQLVEYLKSLSPAFQERPSQPVHVTADPGAKRADLAKGKQLYAALGCAACHGPQGRANGSSAPSLVDDWGKAIRPANLTEGWNYHGGSDPKSVMLRVITGIDGTPMPSYAEAVSPDDAWHLAYYVASLQEPPQWNMITPVASTTGVLPSTLDDARWARVERTDVRVRNAVDVSGEWVEEPTINHVTLQALSNGEAMAFRLSWDDPTQDDHAPSDGLALFFKPDGAVGDVITLQAWPYEGAPPLDLCYWWADRRQMSETLAFTYEPVMTRQMKDASLMSVAAYEDGRWILVLQRPLQPLRPVGAALLKRHHLTAVAVAIWDGAHARARAVSPWIDLMVDGESTGTFHKVH